MTQPTTPRFGDLYNFTQRQSGWMGPLAIKTARDSTFIGLTLKSKTVTAQPGSPVDGDAYWNPAGSTGAFWGVGGNQNKVVVYFAELPLSSAPVVGYTPAGGWVAFAVPRGLLAEIQDEAIVAIYDGATTWNNILATIVGALVYQGTVNMSADPGLPSPAVGNRGYYYVVSVASAGDVSYANLPTSRSYNAGDTVISRGSGATWDVVDAVNEDVAGTANTILQRTSTGGGNFGGDVKITSANLGVGAAPAWPLDMTQAATAASGNAYGAKLAQTLNAAANGDALYGLYINPTYSDHSMSGVQHFIQGWASVALLNQSGSFITTGQVIVGPLSSSTVVPLDILKAVTAGAGSATGARAQQTLTAAADNDVLTALYINPTFADAGHAGVIHYMQGWGPASAFVAYVDGVGNMMAPKQSGATGAAGNLTLESTTHATKGKILFGASAYDEANNRLGIGGSSPSYPVDVSQAITAAAGVAYGGRFAQTLTAAANNDVLTALYINPTFNDGGKTGVTHYFVKWGSVASVDSTGQFAGLGVIRSGTYSARGSASSYGANAYFLATDIGLSPGCLFRSDGTNWLQLGEHYLCVNTSNVVADSGHLVKSIFDTAPTLPNGCLAVGTKFEWAFRMRNHDAGPDDAAVVYGMLIGATDVGNLTYAAFAEYNNAVDARMNGEMVVRSLGASGSVMGTMNYYYTVDAPYIRHAVVEPATATTVDTTGTISPDVKITLSSISASPTRTIIEAWIRVRGLVG